MEQIFPNPSVQQLPQFYVLSTAFPPPIPAHTFSNLYPGYRSVSVCFLLVQGILHVLIAVTRDKRQNWTSTTQTRSSDPHTQYYFHKVSVILNNDLQRESNQLYSPVQITLQNQQR